MANSEDDTSTTNAPAGEGRDGDAPTGDTETDSSKRRRSRPRRWRDIDPTRRGVVVAWLSFTVTFALARLVTGVIELGDGSTGNVDVGGVHLHHYVWGILLVIATAAFGLVDRSTKVRSWMGLTLGVGTALIVDEAALLITLKDKYWSSESWGSVAVAVVIVSVLGTALVITRSGRREEDANS